MFFKIMSVLLPNEFSRRDACTSARRQKVGYVMLAVTILSLACTPFRVASTTFSGNIIRANARLALLMTIQFVHSIRNALNCAAKSSIVPTLVTLPPLAVVIRAAKAMSRVSNAVDVGLLYQVTSCVHYVLKIPQILLCVLLNFVQLSSIRLGNHVLLLTVRILSTAITYVLCAPRVVFRVVHPTANADPYQKTEGNALNVLGSHLTLGLLLALRLWVRLLVYFLVLVARI